LVDQNDTIEAALRAARALESAGRTAEATDLLRRAAAGGNSSALAAFGKHLLIHRPDCAGEGLKALDTAAQSGNGEAAHLLSVFIAEGVGFPQSWQAAFAALQHAADLKWLPAEREIEFLRDEFKGTGLQDLDLSRWLKAAPAHLLSPQPRILAVKNFASPRICDRLIELARPRLKAAQTFDPETGAGQYESSRNNSDCHLILPYSDLVLALVRARIAALIQMPPSFFETPTMLHYKPGETFSPHYDFLDDTKPGHFNEIARNGQRVLTFLLYLNESFDGGETEFPLIGLRYKGNKGDALCFWNVMQDGSPDRRALHAGLPPTRGEKWLLSQWIRNTAM
jgi:prolyl 4-hydroxylase